MTKFIELTELDGTEFVINATCIQMVFGCGLTRLRICNPTDIEFIDVKDSYEEVKTKLGAI